MEFSTGITMEISGRDSPGVSGMASIMQHGCRRACDVTKVQAGLRAEWDPERTEVTTLVRYLLYNHPKLYRIGPPKFKGTCLMLDRENTFPGV